MWIQLTHIYSKSFPSAAFSVFWDSDMSHLPLVSIYNTTISRFLTSISFHRVQAVSFSTTMFFLHLRLSPQSTFSHQNVALSGVVTSHLQTWLKQWQLGLFFAAATFTRVESQSDVEQLWKTAGERKEAVGEVGEGGLEDQNGLTGKLMATGENPTHESAGK